MIVFRVKLKVYYMGKETISQVKRDISFFEQQLGKSAKRYLKNKSLNILVRYQ